MRFSSKANFARITCACVFAAELYTNKHIHFGLPTYFLCCKQNNIPSLMSNCSFNFICLHVTNDKWDSFTNLTIQQYVLCYEQESGSNSYRTDTTVCNIFTECERFVPTCTYILIFIPPWIFASLDLIMKPRRAFILTSTHLFLSYMLQH